MYKFIYYIIVLLINLLTVIPAFANNLFIENVSVEGRNPVAKTAVIQFDISWNNSWRTKISHDAVWITVRLHSAAQSPVHKRLCQLSASGINPSGTQKGSNQAIEIAVPADKRGAFIRSSGYGTKDIVQSTNVELTIDYASCGFSSSDSVHASVFGLEMVSVPRGAFYAGDHNGSSAALHEGSADSDPWYIAAEGPLNVTNAATNGFRYVSFGHAGEDTTGAAFTVPANYPKGYNAFYVMKYELTEGQWAEFVNSLPAAARANRDLTNASHKNTDLAIKRNTLNCGGSPIVCSTSRPHRAVNIITWMALAAFLDWAALRPMTELEFEKAARGPLLPEAGEFAWGTAVITAAAGISAGAETGAETVTTGGANAHYGNVALSGGDTGSGAEYQRGPLRSGIFATATSVRESAGASYYGIMELSGNLRERVVTIGNAAGRNFQGSHGNGTLSTESGFEGNATQPDWPGIDALATRGVTGAFGSGFRGGGWDDNAVRLSVSDRADAANATTAALSNSGGRGVRTNDID